MCSAVNITAGFQVILAFCLVSVAQGKRQTFAIQHLLAAEHQTHGASLTIIEAVSVCLYVCVPLQCQHLNAPSQGRGSHIRFSLVV